MANHGAATTLILIASLLVAVAVSGADARFVTVRRDANGGYVPEAAAKFPQLACNKVVGVQPGETCSSVAKVSGLSQDDFLAFNPNINCDAIFVGQWVCLLAQGA